MTDVNDMTDRDDFLDFPGADELIAAGTVAPPTNTQVMAVRDILALVADRETEAVSGASAHDRVVPLATARRGGPVTSLAPPEDPLVVLDPDGPGTAPRRRRRLSRRGRFLVAAAAVAAIAAGAAVYPVVDLGGKPPSAASAASEFLNDMARVSAEAPATHGKYWMIRYFSKEGRHSAWQTLYYGRDGDTWLLQPNGKAKSIGRNYNDWIVNGRHVTWAELDRLPTDPKKLRTHFPKDAQTWSQEAVSLLADSPASPALRSALFQMIAKSPVVTMTPGIKDSRGRQGTEILIHSTTWTPGNKPPGAKPVLIKYQLRFVVDPKTSRVLETRAAGRNPDVRTTYFEAGLRNRIG